MSTQAEDSILKEQMIALDHLYRELVEKHHLYDDRLNELAALHFPSEEEQVEEHDLKKLKLAIKDEMEEILSRHRLAVTS